ncbi:hypothetical protein H0H81_002874 [Sphagnurus paluster]|uniref:Uncharacterized protein n=1 Tax=Sphagnurus paluster TaxID=117069 RepID=A0A9P7KHQ9_9AGAR|nr:hypothetical protein H0H81_002874 [Sphagnurus paluster]
MVTSGHSRRKEADEVLLLVILDVEHHVRELGLEARAHGKGLFRVAYADSVQTVRDKETWKVMRRTWPKEEAREDLLAFATHLVSGIAGERVGDGGGRDADRHSTSPGP